MKPESDVITVCGKYRIYYEHYKREGAAKTAIMVNGALATTVSFSQTIRNLNGHVNVVLFDLPFAGQSRKHNAGKGILTKEDEVRNSAGPDRPISGELPCIGFVGRCIGAALLGQTPSHYREGGRSLIFPSHQPRNARLHDECSGPITKKRYPWRSTTPEQYGRKISSTPAETPQSRVSVAHG
jgi:pimeloyl-ACP methyl ester carboxylesterase